MIAYFAKAGVQALGVAAVIAIVGAAAFAIIFRLTRKKESDQPQESKAET